MNRDQITDKHRSRMALVYIRQSSPHQVVHHQESQLRQRNFVERAMELGWSKDQIHTVDEDLGVSGSRSGNRYGFDQMVSMAALGKVGIILSLEVARLARGNRNWYHLLDVCGITGTLIADDDGLYDTAAYNDRLLLGLKGTMSEAELYLMKQRLVEAVRAKAKRGELRQMLPAAFIWDEAGRIQKNPDERVVEAIKLVFHRFEQLGTIHQTHLYLVEDGVEIPVCVSRGKGIQWNLPNYGLIQRILTSPVYAGAYAYGMRQIEETLDSSLNPRKRVRKVPQEKWHTLLKDHHEGYISWEQFEINRKRIRSNGRPGKGPGAPREGDGLLQGIILCGRCGRRMRISYGKGSRPTHYSCAQARKQTGAPVCQSFGARRLEKAVEGLLLDCLSPLGVEAMLEAANVYTEDNELERTRWKQNIERAHYEMNLARRQYDAVDPENRLVARELERRYEKALRALEEIESEAEQQLQRLEEPFTDAEHRLLKRYAEDLSLLWNVPATRAQDRKRIARCLIENVVVTSPREGTMLIAQVHWKGGEVTKLDVLKGKSGIHRYVSPPELVELIRKLATEFSDIQIARILHRKRLKTPKGRPFMAYHVANVRNKYNIPKGPRVPLRGEDVYTAEKAAELLGACRSTVIRWLGVGLLRGSQLTSGAPWRIVVTKEDIERLKPNDVGDGWLPLKGTAAALGVSQQTVLQKVKSGELEAIRVRTGRRVGWRIRLPISIYDDQPALF